MPLVQLTFIEGVLPLDKRTALIEEVTEAVLRVAGEPLRGALWVIIEDVPSGSWGVGGRALTTVDVTKALSVGAIGTAEHASETTR